jgi:hypothetical protein
MTSFKIQKIDETKITLIDSKTDWRTYDGSSNNLINPWWGVVKML